MRAYRRHDETDDALFYRVPRLVTHIDDAAIAAVTGFYRETLPAGGAILDLMSSWVSHLPAEVDYAEVVGLGMNEFELSRNPRLTGRVVHDLNADPTLPFDAGRFDAATLCVSVDYLARPAVVLGDVARVVRAGGPLVLTFSDRCFPTKAVRPWLEADDRGRIALVVGWLAESGRWGPAEAHSRGRRRPAGDPLYSVIARSLGPAVAAG